ncbi:MAG: dihydroorotate dehydrogenase electron transfer subunit [Oligosphaeraceae bacterium]|nr:dihydroorotate dehydrogenase electron transfer subunit [Oligosphaeraceae bacterium]
MNNKVQVDAVIRIHEQIRGAYRQLYLEAPAIAQIAEPGQFVHLQLPGLAERVLRRPFSICAADAGSGRLRLVYKVVGVGTEHLQALQPGQRVNVLGPLGKGFSPLPRDRRSILVGGGYGCAAMYFVAQRAGVLPLVLLGARGQEDVILAEEFQALGCEVRIATDDGTLGQKGRVTVLLEQAAQEFPQAWLAACGPLPMLKALSQFVARQHWDGELSLDSAMCCGMGACFACVIKRKADNEQGWSYARVCHDGPVFKAGDIYWE